MSRRTRKHVLFGIVLVVGLAYGRLSLSWSLLELYGGMAVILTTVAVVGLPWMELAPDGAFRRRPQA